MKIQCTLADMFDAPLEMNKTYTIHPVRDVFYNATGCFYRIDGELWSATRFEILEPKSLCNPAQQLAL